jgi:hypothetical protein
LDINNKNINVISNISGCGGDLIGFERLTGKILAINKENASGDNFTSSTFSKTGQCQISFKHNQVQFAQQKQFSIDLTNSSLNL